jgi:uncharacterized damage-inducible protein DinB
MQYSDRDLFLKWWSDAQAEGLWAASWSKSLEGLTAAQAAWQPRGQDGKPHHSIWQNVEHLIFWRENWLGRLDGGPRPTEQDLAAQNFPQPKDPSEAAWADARRRLQESHDKVAAAVRDRSDVAAPMMWFLPHDMYHFGQINYIRALQGLKPIE